jgi:hypothetical protein
VLAEEGGDEARVVVGDAAEVGSYDVAWGVVVGEIVEEDEVEDGAAV